MDIESAQRISALDTGGRCVIGRDAENRKSSRDWFLDLDVVAGLLPHESNFPLGTHAESFLALA
uniref:Uncharacterized protein n=1 Tax=Bionectria ochroleuca TaxID=29856 RepID=A0A0B7JM59_BIOOC